MLPARLQKPYTAACARQLALLLRCHRLHVYSLEVPASTTCTGLRASVNINGFHRLRVQAHFDRLHPARPWIPLSFLVCMITSIALAEFHASLPTVTFAYTDFYYVSPTPLIAF